MIKGLYQTLLGAGLALGSALGLASSGAAQTQSQARDISVLGIKLGTTVAEASTHLSGYQTKLYPGTISFIAASKGRTDSIIVEAINDRVAYISRMIYLRSPQDAVSYSTYEQQLEKKFGPMSSINQQYTNNDADRAVQREGYVDWQYDASGRTIHVGQCVMRRTSGGPNVPSPAGVGDAFPGDNDGRTIGIPSVFMPGSAPNDYASNPNCYVKVHGYLERRRSSTPIGGIDSITLELTDQQPFAVLVMNSAAKEKRGEQERKKALDQKSGPPM